MSWCNCMRVLLYGRVELGSRGSHARNIDRDRRLDRVKYVTSSSCCIQEESVWQLEIVPRMHVVCPSTIDEILQEPIKKTDVRVGSVEGGMCTAAERPPSYSFGLSRKPSKATTPTLEAEELSTELCNFRQNQRHDLVKYVQQLSRNRSRTFGNYRRAGCDGVSTRRRGKHWAGATKRTVK